jgi:hypothetical protein
MKIAKPERTLRSHEENQERSVTILATVLYFLPEL